VIARLDRYAGILMAGLVPAISILGGTNRPDVGNGRRDASILPEHIKTAGGCALTAATPTLPISSTGRIGPNASSSSDA
jgi:hypothetical protein